MYIPRPAKLLFLIDDGWALNTVTPSRNGLNWSSSACSPAVPLQWGYAGTAAHLPIAHTPNTLATAIKEKAAAPVA